LLRNNRIYPDGIHSVWEESAYSGHRHRVRKLGNLTISIGYPVAGAFRLAKFNTDDRQTEQFLGMPIPANALFFASLGLIFELGTNQALAPVILKNMFCLLLFLSALS
jgi:phosphatidylserine synthase